MSQEGKSSPPTSYRIAVLPLANISPNPSDEYFADGMTEELIATLSKLSGLGVIARTSILRYKGLTKPVAEIGKELSVATVLEGSVRIAGKKIRITAQLIDTTTEEHVWSEVYDRELEDVFAIQSDIARRIAQALKIKVLKEEGTRIEARATEKPEAYRLYLKGRHLLNARTEESLHQAVSAFEEALERDPDYELAYTGLADTHAVLALLEFVSPKQAFPRAKAAAEKALEIDKDLAEAHTSLGVVKFQYDWDLAGAEKEFRKAIELHPNHAPAHQFYADCLKASGRFDEALAEMRQASQLDPLSLSINTGIGHVLYLSRNYDRAIEQYRETVKLDPNFVQARLWLGRPFLQKGMYKEAVAELIEAAKLSKDSTVSLATLGQAYAASGDRKHAQQILDRLKQRSKTHYVPSYWIALLYVSLGDKRQAFEWLDRAYEERSSWLAWIKVEPRFDPILDDPRFANLLRRMGLLNKDEKLPAKGLGISGWLKGPVPC
jgi:adenylate cyclase